MLRRVILALLICSLSGLLLAPASLAGWCGENGVVRFSFEEGSDLVSVANIAAGDNGVTMVDLYAWLTEVVPLQKNGEAFLGMAALELQLVIEGAEGFILKQEYPQESKQVGKSLGNCIVGFSPGLKFTDGATQLVHWQIMFQGSPENVVFRLDSEGLITCERTEGCSGSGVSALYTGTQESRFIGSIFGAGYQAAYLNYDGEPDLKPVTGSVSWEEVGEFSRR